MKVIYMETDEYYILPNGKLFDVISKIDNKVVQSFKMLYEAENFISKNSKRQSIKYRG